MAATKMRSTLWLIGHSMLPTSASISVCVLASALIVGGSILLDSLNYGTFLPNVLDGQWATWYTNTIVQPIESVINSMIWNRAVFILLWSLLGLGLYSLVELGVRGREAWREVRTDVQYIDDRTVVHHPLMRTFLTRSLWRLVIGVLAGVFVVLVHPLAQHTFADLHNLVFGVNADDTHEALRGLGFALLVWMLICHVLTVLARLYSFRTRLLGERLY